MSSSAPSQPTTDGRTGMVRSSRPRPRGAHRRSGFRVGRSLLLAPVLAMTVGLSAACADDAGPAVPNLPPIPTALPSGLPTTIPTSVPTKAPADEPQGTPLGYDGALLQATSLPVETSAGAGASCDDVVDNERTADDCGAVANYAWVVSRHG